jgi:hypothetical protein
MSAEFRKLFASQLKAANMEQASLFGARPDLSDVLTLAAIDPSFLPLEPHRQWVGEVIDAGVNGRRYSVDDIQLLVGPHFNELVGVAQSMLGIYRTSFMNQGREGIERVEALRNQLEGLVGTT